MIIVPDPIRLADLCKSYPVNADVAKTVVSISDLQINFGSFTCIVGKNGCGKTTLLRLLAGLEHPTKGSISSLPRKISLVFQDPRLLPWLTVTENIALARKGRKQPPNQKNSRAGLAQLLEDLELSETADFYPNQLSGGMAQRVSLGRALFYDADLILMDEPFSALDYFTRQHLQKLVLRLFQYSRKTIVFVTHDVEEALLLGDRLLVMETGSIKADLSLAFPRPRTAADPEFQLMRQKILQLLGE